MLAAVRRAERHSHSHAGGASWSEIAGHLGWHQRTPRIGETKDQVDGLVAAGVLERSQSAGQNRWSVTSKGRGRLQRARAQEKLPGLPEAPQHHVWRRANEDAKERIDGLTHQVQQTLKRAQRLMKSGKGAAREWAELSITLRRQCGQLAWAIYCTREWPEPDDTDADISEGARRRELGLSGADFIDACS